VSRPEDALGHPRLVVGDRVVCEHGGPGTYLGTEHGAFAVRLDNAEMTWAHPHMVKRIGPEHGDAIVSAVERCADVLTGEEVLAIRAALPLVANEWRRRGTTHHTRAWDNTTGVAAEVSPPTEDDPTWLAWVEGTDDTEHPTEAEALVSCDTRLRAMGIALCGEVHS
jgi:hypothetical protein